MWQLVAVEAAQGSDDKGQTLPATRFSDLQPDWPDRGNVRNAISKLRTEPNFVLGDIL
jgi:hypothetical protein